MSNSLLALLVSNTPGTPGDRTPGAIGASPGVNVSGFLPGVRTFRFGLTPGDTGTRVELQASNDAVNWQSIDTFNAGSSNPDEGIKIDDNSFFYRTLRIAGSAAVTCIIAGQDAAGGSAPIVVNPNAIVYGDALGVPTSDIALVALPLDPQGRPQVWDHRAGGAGAIYRNGAWQADGDPSSIKGDGIVSYGPNSLGLGPNAADGGYARVKFNRFGLAQIIPAVAGGALFYAIRLDSDPLGGIDGMQFKDDEQAALQLSIARSTGTIQFGSPVSPALAPGSARFFGNQSGSLFGSNAGMQYSSLIANRAQLRANAFGAHTGVAGITGFKSRGATIGSKLRILAGDVMFRATAVGVPNDDTSLNLAGLLSLQAGLVGLNFVSTDFEVALATTTSGTRPCWTAKGETGELIGSVSNGIVRENLGGALVGLGPILLTWTPGAVAPLAPGVIDSWAALMLIHAATRGPITVYLDTSIAPAIVPVGVWDVSRVTFAGPAHIALAVLSMSDGAQLVNVAGFDRVTFVGAGALVNPLAFTTSDFLVLTNGADISNVGVAPVVALVGGFALKMTLENSSQVSAGNFLESAASSFTCSILSGSSMVSNSITADGASRLQCFFDSASAFPTMIGSDASSTWDGTRAPVGLLPNTLTVTQGATGQIYWGQCFSWPDMHRLFAGYTQGAVDLALNQGTLNVGPGSYDLQGRGTLITAQPGPNANFTILDIFDTSEIVDPAGFEGVFTVRGNGAAVNPILFTATYRRCIFGRGVVLDNLGAAPLVSSALDLTFPMIGCEITPAIRFLDAQAGGTLNIRASEGTIIPTDTITVDAAAALNWTTDPSSAITTQVGVAGTVTILGNDGFPHGSSALALGVTAFIPVPGLKTGSAIHANLRTPGGVTTLTSQYAPLDADRTYGLGGGFIVTATLAAGGPNVADLSTVDWSVVL